MHILFTRFPLESAHGGAENQTISLMGGLKDRGHEVSFLGSCPILLGESGKLKVESTKLDIGIPPVTKWGAVSFAWRRFGMQKALKRQLSAISHQPSAIVMLGLSEKLLITPMLKELTANGSQLKAVWLEHDPLGRWLTRNPWLPRLRSLSKNVTTVCVSEMSRKMYLDLGWDADKVVAIPNGIDCEQFGRYEVRGTRYEVLRLGCVSRLAKEKGIDLLIHALEGITDVHLTIVGKGPEEKNLKEIAQQFAPTSLQTYKPTNLVTFKNYIEGLPAFYNEIDALILPSRTNDPFGLVAAEAMASGTPIIVTNTCGIAGYLEGDEGIVVPADSPEALREAIEKLKNPELRKRMSEAGRRAAEDKFSVMKMIDRYENLFLR